ncbi:hypothetical protein B8V81_1876 [Paenibacillus pasadenensis]|uniref:Uncharacterized protein n=1 Tax=Paenibacillus pasadenensis TaxID=217090 RepID=A0A2N5NBD3_9BACL|nr:hypothetical protein B8V81_1876 [Paenibacillus pasadenensis]
MRRRWLRARQLGGFVRRVRRVRLRPASRLSPASPLGPASPLIPPASPALCGAERRRS